MFHFNAPTLKAALAVGVGVALATGAVVLVTKAWEATQAPKQN